MVRYFKPRKDLDYSSSLLPHKSNGGKQFKFVVEGNGSHKHWVEHSPVSIEQWGHNFIEVKTEQEAVEGY
jgi:hypothetical protein